MTIFNGIMSVIISVAVAFIAFRQWRTAIQKVKLDLFERRFKVFKAARTMVHQATTDFKLDDVKTNEWHRATEEMEFLFKEHTVKFLKDLLHTALQSCVTNTLERQVEHQKHVDKLVTADADLIREFKPYLDFRNLK